MKLLPKLLIAAAAIALAAPASSAEVKREHRAVWVSAFLSDWPTAALTNETQVNRQVRNLETQLDRYQKHNINTLYFHVRSHCDALYNSAYEPWSRSVAGSRGGDAPLIDPLATIIEKCHDRGIELYAWINPYRYCGSTMYGAGERNYENTHPEWLLTKKGDETILNPALPEVRQRIVDVCKDILEKYDVDGLIFDDYFYTTGTPMANDAEQYKAYKDAGGTDDQAKWRRENVNQMITDVRDMIAKVKPYVCFAISPAGKCNPPDIASYGLPKSTMSDWQYSGIHSDPVAWLHRGIIDMVSPQLYWSIPGGFDEHSQWWALVTGKFGRNLSVSAGVSSVISAGYKADQFVQQQLWCRSVQQPDQSGLSFFNYSPMNNYREKDEATGTNQPLSYFMWQGAYQSVALQPLRPWRNDYKPQMVSNITFSDGLLSWIPTEAGRYTVYAIPESLSDKEFKSQPEYLLGVTYEPGYTIPEDFRSGYRYAVAVYDRYGNEYAPLIMGANATNAKAPKLTSPADNARFTPLGSFEWEGNEARYLIEIAEDNDSKEMTHVLAAVETNSTSLSSAAIKVLDKSKSYLWRVTASSPNALEASSPVQRFHPAKLEILTPANGETKVAETPTFTFTKAVDGCDYFLEISTTNKFSPIVYSAHSSTPEIALSEGCIATGTTYYARVTITLGEEKLVSDEIKFSTLDVAYDKCPGFVNPAADGQTIFSNQTIQLEQWHGITGVTIEVSETEAFPTRGATLTTTLTGFATETKPLGEMKIQNNALVDGKTYYLRARGRYLMGGSSTKYTDYTPVITFVYSSETGVSDINADPAGATYFNLQGLPVTAPQKGQLLIRRTANKAEKVVIR